VRYEDPNLSLGPRANLGPVQIPCRPLRRQVRDDGSEPLELGSCIPIRSLPESLGYYTVVANVSLTTGGELVGRHVEQEAPSCRFRVLAPTQVGVPKVAGK